MVGPLDWGVLLAALLTAAARPALPTSPAFGFDAPSQASGKTLLASCVGVLATGGIPTVWPHTAGHGNDEETRKRLFVALRNGDRALVWDNVVGTFDSAAMASALTSENMTDRILGKSERISIPNRAIILLTGNNLTFSGDLARRILKCRIDTESERPFARQFDLDPLTYVRAHRQKLLSAALTIIRGYLNSGAPPAAGRMASFELWDDYVRQTVVWVGREIRPSKFGDPMDAVVEAQTSDPEQEAFGDFLAVWRELFKGDWVSASDVFKEASSQFGDDRSSRLLEVLYDLKGGRQRLSSKGVGRLLAYRLGRIVHGLRLEARKDKSSGSKLWRVAESE